LQEYDRDGIVRLLLQIHASQQVLEARLRAHRSNFALGPKNLRRSFLPSVASALRIDKFAHVFDCIAEEHGGGAIDGLATLLEYSELPDQPHASSMKSDFLESRTKETFGHLSTICFIMSARGTVEAGDKTSFTGLGSAPMPADPTSSNIV